MKLEQKQDPIEPIEDSETSLTTVNDNPHMEGNIELEPGEYVTAQSLLEENIELKAMLEKRNKDVLELIEDLSNLGSVMYGIVTSSLTKKKIKEEILEYLSRYMEE